MILFKLWLIAGIILAVLSIIPTVMILNLFFGKKTPIEKYLREEYNKRVKISKARNDPKRPVFIKPKL